MRTLTLLFVLACLSLAILAGCNQEPSNSCVLERDCAPGNTCVQGLCQPKDDGCKQGQTRACYTGPADTRGKGACRDGSQSCTPNGTWGPCQGDVKPTEESCDGKDNNCDGQKDNVQGKTEICNGLDDDCDGRIDNQAGSTKALQRECYTGKDGTAGKGACKKGTQICNNGKWPANCPSEVTPKEELCQNQIDDDCDGIVDNVKDLGKPCTDPSRTGGCQDGTWSCEPNKPRTCRSPSAGKPEICNNQDDDCDGQIDNQKSSKQPLERKCPTYNGPAGTRDVGECKGGVQQCKAGQWSTSCVNQVTPSNETCNGKDDDCDGSIDENLSRACYTGPEGTKGVGSCKGGTQTCSQGKWSTTCKGEVAPKEELCQNGVDEDCDGVVDNVKHLGKPCLDPKRKGACQIGVYVCQGTQRVCRQTRTSQKEECNGLDDDCDGQIDNRSGVSAAITRACYTGTSNTRKKGECRDGQQTCIQGNWSPLCQGQQVPRPELCNKRDDDCNGAIDDAGACATCSNGTSRACYTGPSNTRKKGGCRDGQENCQGGRWSGQCLTAVLPSTEVCDGKDNDCDGINDEDNVCQTKQRQVQEICSSAKTAPAGLKCGFGLICLQARVDTPDEFCYQNCADNSNCAKNKDGRTTCLKLNKSTGICVAAGEVNTFCDVQMGIFCKNGLFCDMSLRRCRYPAEAPPLGRCGPSTGFDCGKGYHCHGMTVGAPTGYCLKTCGQQSDCTGGGVCISSDSGKNVCLPVGNRRENQVCGGGDKGAKLDTSRSCAKGLACIRPVGTNPLGICRRLQLSCHVDGRRCFAGELCVSQSFCIRTCGACAADQVCRNFGNAKTCVPKPPSGNVPYGSVCSNLSTCQSGLNCLGVSDQAPRGFCSKLSCSVDADCPRSPAGSVCRSVLGLFKACVFPCNAGQTCPAGLQCERTSGYCVAP